MGLADRLDRLHYLIGIENNDFYNMQGVVHLPIAHALCLPEPNKKTNLLAVSLRFAPVLWPPSDLFFLVSSGRQSACAMGK